MYPDGSVIQTYLGALLKIKFNFVQLNGCMKCGHSPLAKQNKAKLLGSLVSTLSLFLLEDAKFLTQ